MFGDRNFESRGGLHIYGHDGTMTVSHTNNNGLSSSSSSSSTQVLRDSYNNSGTLFSQSSQQQNSSSSDEGVRGSIAQQRRRSHRPRGCRGGRKNRKNREAKAAREATGGEPMIPRAGSPPHNKPVSESVPVTQGDLSRYQHFKTSASRNNNNVNAWTQRSPSILPPPSNRSSNSSSKDATRQMLPPPLPPFVNGTDPFVAKPVKDISRFLKMLPSFEEPDQSFSSSSQDMSLEFSVQESKLPLWEQQEPPMCSAISSSSSSTSSGDETGSLFATSPRSFLMGNLVQVDGFPRSDFSLW